jgi:hypothetical protein
MLAIMYDGLELGTFYRDENNVLRLKLHENIKPSWLPYIFEIGLKGDMEKIFPVWRKERIFPKNRLGYRKMLKELGLKKYDAAKIAEITHCSVITDPYWIVYKDSDRYYTCSIRGQMGQSRYPYNSLELANEEDYVWRK